MMIYRAVFKRDGRTYIGQTKDFEKRIETHLQYREHRHSYFTRQIRKYGVNAFAWDILRNCNSKEEANIWERHYIQKFNSFNKSTGFNLTIGGGGGDTFSGLSKEQKRKWRMEKSRAMKGENNPFYGRHHSEETKRKLSAILKGRKCLPFSEEHRRKLSQSSKGNKGALGYKHSEESRKFMSDQKMGDKNPAKRSDVRLKMSINHADVSGKNNPNYKHGKCIGGKKSGSSR
jgi:predicted GIY-YIG superfamily endonuclease